MSERDELEKKLRQLREANWENQKSYYDLSAPQNFSVQILPDKSVTIAMFKPHDQVQGAYKAHPDTIRAMKKDIFVAGEVDDEFQEVYTCESCQYELDKQYWHFCPKCGTTFRDKN